VAVGQACVDRNRVGARTLCSRNVRVERNIASDRSRDIQFSAGDCAMMADIPTTRHCRRSTVWVGVALAGALAATALVEVTGAGAQSRGPQSVAPIAEKLVSAVVNISTSQTVKGSSGAPLPRVPKGSPFEEFFDDFFKSGKSGGQERKVSSLGSGFVID